MTLTRKQIESFRHKIIAYYEGNRRDFPWRETHDPYCILVSEIMLQQTQTSRVVEKYLSFIDRFPTIQLLAESSFTDVLDRWQGLGYNRRARFAYESAKLIVEKYNGAVPNNVRDLIQLSGVGPNTAGAVLAYAFDTRSVFIETNIRTVYLHYFFQNVSDVTDKELLLLIERTLPDTDYRDWYYALTDYGVHLKETVGNQNRRSKHYTKQSAFEGSRRQIQADILQRLLVTQLSIKEIHEIYRKTEHDVEAVVKQLEKENMITGVGETYTITP